MNRSKPTWYGANEVLTANPGKHPVRIEAEIKLGRVQVQCRSDGVFMLSQPEYSFEGGLLAGNIPGSSSPIALTAEDIRQLAEFVKAQSKHRGMER